MGDKVTLSVTSFGVSNLTWTSSNSSIATVSSSGIVTGISVGVVTITCTGTTGSSFLSDTCTVRIVPIADGIYYISNVQLSQLMQGTENSHYNERITLDYFHYPVAYVRERQQFEIKWEDSLSCYSIKSVYTGNYLSMYSFTQATGVEVCEQTVLNSSLSHWLIDKTPSGFYRITPEWLSVTNYCLGSNISSDESGNVVQQQLYSSDSNYRDEWMFCPISSNVERITQTYDSSCWAACAMMASTAYMKSPISQESLMVRVMSDNITNYPTNSQVSSANIPATLEETEQALEILLSTDQGYSREGVIYGESVLALMLDYGNPVIAFIAAMYSDVVIGGHFIVIYDYTMNGSNYTFHIYDPQQSEQTIELSYTELCSYELENHAGTWYGVVCLRRGPYASVKDYNFEE